jgi:hypothetical protein
MSLNGSTSFRDVIRDRARTVLDGSPNAIPGWHLETAIIKKLVRDKESK